MKRLQRLFRKAASPLLVSLGLAFGAAAQGQDMAAPKPVGCPAFPDFQKPEIPMHRISRNIPPDPAIEDKQELLYKINIDPGRKDGRPGTSVRMAEREFLLLYGPLYGAKDFDHDLTREDIEKLRGYAGRVAQDAKAHGLTTGTAAALRLAAEHTGVSIARLAAVAKNGDGVIDGVNTTGSSVAHLFKFDNTTWLYLLKNYGAPYGLDFYARHITLGQKNGDVTASIENPFIHEQALKLKDNKRLSALMAAEYLRHEKNIPTLDLPALPAFSARVQAEQTALAVLGFDIGAARADGVKGTLTDIRLRQFQLLHGDGKPTGTLSAKERDLLLAAAARATAEGAAYDVSSAAVGAIRMASARNNGLEFGYMMELAEAESGFIHSVKAKTSSATGLYQFIESTWHYMVKTYGHKYGLAPYASEIEIYMDDYGRPQARMANPFVRGGAVDLRKQPHVSALFSADFQLENKAKELCYVTGGHLSRADLYLAHFLGAPDAVYYINEMRVNGAKSAVDTFPEAAEYNANVFYSVKNRVRRERSLSEVHGFFSQKFNKGIYDGPLPEARPVQAAPVKKQAAKKKKKKPAQKKKKKSQQRPQR